MKVLLISSYIVYRAMFGLLGHIDTGTVIW